MGFPAGFPDYRISGFADFRISGFPDFQDFWISGFPDFWRSLEVMLHLHVCHFPFIVVNLKWVFILRCMEDPGVSGSGGMSIFLVKFSGTWKNTSLPSSEENEKGEEKKGEPGERSNIETPNTW